MYTLHLKTDNIVYNAWHPGAQLQQVDQSNINEITVQFYRKMYLFLMNSDKMI